MIPALGKALLFAVLSVAGVTAPTALRPRGQRALPPVNVMRARGHHSRAERGITPAGAESVEAKVSELRELPPVLLTTPAYFGTLAAVRSLGRDSIQVTTAGPTPWAISGWSKYASTHVECPPTIESEAFLQWLLEFGRRSERHVLLPTCDDTAWLYARHRERLQQYFHVASSGIDAVHSLLHKGRLAEHARAAGLTVPRSWLPQSEQEVAEIAREATFPVLLKPITQVLYHPRSKGGRVDYAGDLEQEFARAAALTHGRELTEFDPSAARPMVQEYFPDAVNNIYNISSYAHEGKLWGARAGRKILQRPKRMGVGVCFEEASVDEDLLDKLEELVRRVGFSGVFEAEFIESGGRRYLIDFNPRFYNQMGFDVARGLPLPTLAYFGALHGSPPRAESPRAESPRNEGSSPKVFAYGAAFKVMIASQRLSGALSSEEAAAWLAWYEAHEGRRVDAVSDPDDAWPGRLDKLQMLKHYLRHPRDFVRTIALNR